jgi:hypothetical protein
MSEGSVSTLAFGVSGESFGEGYASKIGITEDFAWRSGLGCVG